MCKKSSTTKINEHTPYGCSMSTIWAFDSVENKHTFYRGKDCMKKFCTYFFKRICKICNWFWKEKNVTVNKEELKSYQDAKVCYICSERILKKLKIKIIKRSEIIVITQGNTEAQHIILVI